MGKINAWSVFTHSSPLVSIWGSGLKYLTQLEFICGFVHMVGLTNVRILAILELGSHKSPKLLIEVNNSTYTRVHTKT